MARKKKTDARAEKARDQSSKTQEKRGRASGKSGKKEGQHWLDDLGQALARAGLRTRTVAADGNCFFRACCDQLQGNEYEHMELREQVVDFMAGNPDDFAPYMENEEDFTSYCSRMRREGVWAGMHEQVALTRLKGVELCIHQAGQPCWTIRPDFPEIPKGARALHLSYHDGEHYNSVRLADDDGHKPARPIVLSETGNSAPMSSAARTKWEQQVDAVKWGTGCYDSARICSALSEADGDVDEAIEALISHNGHEAVPDAQAEEPAAMQRSPTGHPPDSSDKDTPIEAISPNTQTAQHAVEDGAAEQVPKADKTILGKPSVKGKKHDMWKSVSALKEKAPAKRRPCPCGSGKRYKNCCGVAEQAKVRRKRGTQGKEESVGTELAAPLSNLFI